MTDGAGVMKVIGLIHWAAPTVQVSAIVSVQAKLFYIIRVNKVVYDASCMKEIPSTVS